MFVSRFLTPSRWVRRPYKGRPSYRPVLEPLEDRLALAVILWDGGPHGMGHDWNDPANWVGGHLPGPDDDAQIGAEFAGTTIVSAYDVNINSLTSAASIAISHGTFSLAADSVLDNDLTLSGGTLAVAGTLSVGGAYTQTAGITRLDGGTLAVPLVDLQGGLLTGSGPILGDVQNAGLIDLGNAEHGLAGTLSIAGNYTQTASGVLNVKIGGLGQGTEYDFISVGGTATLDGRLAITLTNHFVPQDGDTFTPLSFGDRTGDFAEVHGLDINPHLAFSLSYDDNNLNLNTYFT